MVSPKDLDPIWIEITVVWLEDELALLKTRPSLWNGS